MYIFTYTNNTQIAVVAAAAAQFTALSPEYGTINAECILQKCRLSASWRHSAFNTFIIDGLH